MGVEFLSPCLFTVGLQRQAGSALPLLERLFPQASEQSLGRQAETAWPGSWGLHPALWPYCLGWLPFPAHLLLPLIDCTFAALVTAHLSTQGCSPLGIQEEPWKPNQILAYRRGWQIAIFSGVLPSAWQVLMWALPPRKWLLHFTPCL